MASYEHYVLVTTTIYDDDVKWICLCIKHSWKLKKFYMIDLLTNALNDQLRLEGNRKFSIRTNWFDLN